VAITLAIAISIAGQAGIRHLGGAEGGEARGLAMMRMSANLCWIAWNSLMCLPRLRLFA
jgi:hypothetical protein